MAPCTMALHTMALHTMALHTMALRTVAVGTAAVGTAAVDTTAARERSLVVLGVRWGKVRPELSFSCLEGLEGGLEVLEGGVRCPVW